VRVRPPAAQKEGHCRRNIVLIATIFIRPEMVNNGLSEARRTLVSLDSPDYPELNMAIPFLHQRAFFFVLLLLLVTFSGDVSQTSGKVWQATASKPSAALPRQIEDRIRRIENGLLVAATDDAPTFTSASLVERLRHYQVPGVSIAVINNFQLEWAHGFGVTEKDGSRAITPDTLFQAGSISKPVTAAAALALMQQGKLKLDEPVNARLRSWRIPDNEFTAQQAVTLRHLLTHRGGLTVDGFIGYAQGREIPPLVNVLDGAAPANSKPIRVNYLPGSRYRYSGGGFTVLQQLLLDVTGKSFPSLMEELIFKQAGMKQSTFAQPLPETWRAQAAQGAFQSGLKVGGGWFVYPEMAAAGLWTTASDLARFAIALQNAARGKDERMLKRATVRQMLTLQGKDDDGDGWGLGIILNGDLKATLNSKGARSLRFSHSGGTVGFRCVMVAYPATGQGAVVMTNSLNGAGLYREALRAIAREYDWPDYLPSRQ
jgi:CubicO group peptidase (beta-lactamase class C family)